MGSESFRFWRVSIAASRDWQVNQFKLKLLEYRQWFSPIMNFLVEGFVAYIRRAMERAVEKAVEDDSEVQTQSFICLSIAEKIFSFSPSLKRALSSIPNQHSPRPIYASEYALLPGLLSDIESVMHAFRCVESGNPSIILMSTFDTRPWSNWPILSASNVNTMRGGQLGNCRRTATSPF